LELRGITKAELCDMLKKYDIGKKPLSLLLGWGQTTVLLYCGMDEIPSNEYTERLYHLYSNPCEYLHMLIDNYDKITPVAFRKSLTALTGLSKTNRIIMLSQIITDISEDNMSLTRLENILIWSQIISLTLYDKALFNDIYQPVKGNYPFKTVVEHYNNIGFLKIGIIKDKKLSTIVNDIVFNQNKNVLIKEEIEIISYVVDMFSWYGEKALVQLLAAERFRLCGPVQNRKRSASNDLIKKVYTEVFEQAKIRKLSDIEGFMAKRMEALRKTTEKLTK